MFEQEKTHVFRITVKKILQRLATVVNCDLENFKDEVIEQFDGYDYEDVEDVVGFENWEDISNDGKYILKVKIDHPNAYEFTLYVNVENKKATIYNIL